MVECYLGAPAISVPCTSVLYIHWAKQYKQRIQTYSPTSSSEAIRELWLWPRVLKIWPAGQIQPKGLCHLDCRFPRSARNLETGSMGLGPADEFPATESCWGCMWVVRGWVTAELTPAPLLLFSPATTSTSDWAQKAPCGLYPPCKKWLHSQDVAQGPRSVW